MLDRRFRSLWIVAPALALLSFSGAADEPDAADRAKLVHYLTATRDQVIAEAAALTDAQWAFKPGADRWGVGDVVEHLALTELFLFSIHEQTMALPAAAAGARAAASGRDETLVSTVTDRSKPATAPEPLEPGARLGSRAEVMAAFRERRDRSIEYARTTGADWRAHVAEGSPLGPIDAYQYLLFIGAHTERHLGQIREVKAHQGFPKILSGAGPAESLRPGGSPE